MGVGEVCERSFKMPLKVYLLGGSASAVILFVIFAFRHRDAHLRNPTGRLLPC